MPSVGRADGHIRRGATGTPGRASRSPASCTDDSDTAADRVKPAAVVAPPARLGVGVVELVAEELHPAAVVAR